MTAHYRPEIDGLRAIAVVGVLLFHAGVMFPGGFTGVDMFFVISGFLITGNIDRRLRAGEFSFRVFWIRRIRRIQKTRNENSPARNLRSMFPVIRNPEITKNMSTPVKPPGNITPAWKSKTPTTAIARNPSISGR